MRNAAAVHTNASSPRNAPRWIAHGNSNNAAGSVRASLVILIMVPFWVLLAVPGPPLGPMPLYLYFLMGLVLLAIFAWVIVGYVRHSAPDSSLEARRGAARLDARQKLA